MKINKIEISTQRTRLRLLELSDLDAVHKLHSLAETDEYNTLGIPKDIEETKLILNSWVYENKVSEVKNYTFVIEAKIDQVFMGLFGLKLGNKKYRSAELWYKLLPSNWNKGIATEVLSKVIDFGFDQLKLHRIHAGCAVNNIGSIKVLEKAGMTLEGRGRQILPLKSGWSDNFEYAILETDIRKGIQKNEF